MATRTAERSCSLAVRQRWIATTARNETLGYSRQIGVVDLRGGVQHAVDNVDESLA